MKPQFSQSASMPAIATRAELNQRLAARPKPAPQMHLTPSGPDALEARRQVNAENEKRIANLRGSLDTAHEILNIDLRLANIRSPAKADFSRSR